MKTVFSGRFVNRILVNRFVNLWRAERSDLGVRFASTSASPRHLLSQALTPFAPAAAARNLLGRPFPGTPRPRLAAHLYETLRPHGSQRHRVPSEARKEADSNLLEVPPKGTPRPRLAVHIQALQSRPLAIANPDGSPLARNPAPNVGEIRYFEE